MRLLAEVPGGRRARVLAFLVVAFCALSVHPVDRLITDWFVSLHLPELPVIARPLPGGIHWDQRYM
jgi:hypothetical protein